MNERRRTRWACPIPFWLVSAMFGAGWFIATFQYIHEDTPLDTYLGGLCTGAALVSLAVAWIFVIQRINHLEKGLTPRKALQRLVLLDEDERVTFFGN
jgi:hypothetical protein